MKNRGPSCAVATDGQSDRTVTSSGAKSGRGIGGTPVNSDADVRTPCNLAAAPSIWKPRGIIAMERRVAVNVLLTQVLADLDLKPGDCQRVQVNGYHLEIRRPAEEESAFAGASMLEPWASF